MATIERLSHDGQVLATYEHGGAGPTLNNFAMPVLSPCGLLFCVGFDDDRTVRALGDEIFVFDSRTLELQSRFGRSTFKYVMGLAVGSFELFVSDNEDNCVKVFSFDGELIRTFSGDCKGPGDIIFVRDRLYIYAPESRHIMVLSPTGDLLQIYSPELQEGERCERGMAVFGGKLVLRTSTGFFRRTNRVIALQGL